MKKPAESLFTKYAWFGVIIVLVALNFVALWIGYNNNYQKIISFLSTVNPTSVAEFVKSFGILAPIVFIIIYILESIFAPVPGQVVTMAAGSLYGPLWGSALAIFGVAFGSIFPFYISKIFGRPVVEKLVDPKQLEKADRFFNEKKGILLFMLIRILPIATFDVISYSAGLTKMHLKKYLIVTFIAAIPKVLVYTNLGHFLIGGSKTALIIFIAMTAFGAFTMFFGFWIFQKIMAHRRSRKAEAEGED